MGHEDKDKHEMADYMEATPAGMILTQICEPGTWIHRGTSAVDDSIDRETGKTREHFQVLFLLVINVRNLDVGRTNINTGER